jgi:cell division initiation protein
MRLTPLEVQNHQFGRRLSGFDPEEVGSFLQMVADDYEKVVRENARMKDQIHELGRRVDELSSGEKILRETLVSAQDMAAKLRETAVAESEVLLRTAESRAEKIIDASHRRAATLGEEIRDLKGLRTRFASSLRSVIDTHLGLIERLEQDPPESIPYVVGILQAEDMAVDLVQQPIIEAVSGVSQGAPSKQTLAGAEDTTNLRSKGASSPRPSRPRAPIPAAIGGP